MLPRPPTRPVLGPLVCPRRRLSEVTFNNLRKNYLLRAPGVPRLLDSVSFRCLSGRISTGQSGKGRERDRKAGTGFLINAADAAFNYRDLPIGGHN